MTSANDRRPLFPQKRTSFGHQRPQVPEVDNDFLANAVDRGTFPQWLVQHATPIDGLSVVVGQSNDEDYLPDSVYAVVKLPPEAHCCGQGKTDTELSNFR